MASEPNATDGRRAVRPSANPIHQAIGRALCEVMHLHPDEFVQGVTGAWWTQWDYVFMHQGSLIIDRLDRAGHVIVAKEIADEKSVGVHSICSKCRAEKEERDDMDYQQYISTVSA